MYTQTFQSYTIRYGESRIVLHGESTAIHHEARYIVRHFTASALPYVVVADFRRWMLLRALR